MTPKMLKRSEVLQNRSGLLFSLKLSTKIMYICGKCNFTICLSVIFPVSMQKTVRPEIGPVKKKTPSYKKTCMIGCNGFHRVNQRRQSRILRM